MFVGIALLLTTAASLGALEEAAAAGAVLAFTRGGGALTVSFEFLAVVDFVRFGVGGRTCFSESESSSTSALRFLGL